MERDDLIVNDSYSLNNTHTDEQGVTIRKKIIKVTVLLSVITAIEVGLGVFIKQGTTMWPVVKWSFIVMTLIKAFYIVAVFMHLGDERKSLRYVILVPYVLFIIYLLFIGITDSNYVNDIWLRFKP
ncbi:MAG: cytochrome C oxidase subunit IV family protein [Cryomorphaceae bacterium]|nr:cytochrome C oxidase subunit IV family protein [Flavobacteriales bacterium]